MKREFPFSRFPFDVTSDMPSQQTFNYPADRRSFLRLAGTGAAGIALGGVVAPISAPNAPAPACSKKSVEIEVSTAITFLNKVSSLLPAHAQLIVKIVGVLNTFNEAYQAGKFDSAVAFLATASSLFEQLLTNVGVGISPLLKTWLLIVDAAITALVALFKSQASAPEAVTAMRSASEAQKKQMAILERRAARVDELFAAIKH